MAMDPGQRGFPTSRTERPAYRRDPRPVGTAGPAPHARPAAFALAP